MEPETFLAYTIAGAVRASGGTISRSELYRAAGRGELTIRKRGKRSVILADEFRKLLESLPAAKLSTRR